MTLHEFWFGTIEDTPAYLERRLPFWFVDGKQIDEEIRRRFSNEPSPHTPKSARESLDAILQADQLPRHIHRGTSLAYATDELARALAHDAIEKGHDRELHVVERIFVYLPFEHSERRDDQKRSVELFAGLLAESPACHRRGLHLVYEFARKHQEAIEAFGRYPHRNEVLGRRSSAAEIEFMKTTRF